MLNRIIILLKKITPFLGITALYFFLGLLIVFLFNYYNPSSLVWAERYNPYYLLIRWDSIHYLNIVLQGYTGSAVFFPLYPLIVYIFSIFLAPVFSGFLVSFLCLSVALYFLNKLLEETGHKNIKERTIVLLLFFPTAMFFMLVYTESLFLALVISFFYYLNRRNWLAAALIGFFLTLTRNIGSFCWPIYLTALFIAYKNTEGLRIGKQIVSIIKKKEFLYSFFIPAGFLAFCTYTYFHSGNLFAFLTDQKNWSGIRSFMWPGETLYNFYKIIFIDSLDKTGLYTFLRIVVIEGGSFLILLAATIYWIIKKHWPYALYCLLNALLFLCLYPMTSVNRYVVVIFPIFIFLAEITKKASWLFYFILAIFFIFFIFNISLFSNGAWVG